MTSFTLTNWSNNHITTCSILKPENLKELEVK